MEATEPAVFEIERFEWAKPDRIELVGTWAGVGARRFIRPTLVLERDGEPVRLLALLDHKPWHPVDGQDWIAAFAWDGEPVRCQSADMNVAPGIDVKLPPPRMRPGKPRRFRQRAVARDATREALAAERASGPGIVTEPPTQKGARPPVARPTAPDPAPVQSGARPPVAQPADVERLRREVDQAREELRAARLALEEERQGRERAVADARAAERAAATTSLSEGAELRAAVERQRELAYAARDEAVRQRDAAIAARERACTERDEAVALRKQAERDRSAADHERDRAVKDAERARAARDKALAERTVALQERDAANQERDTIVSVHERGLPVVPPKPRFGPPEETVPTELDVWGPRVAALIILGIFAVIVLHLFSSF